MEPIYANNNIKKHMQRTTGDGALSEESSKSDDVIYSEVRINNSNQKRAGFSALQPPAQNVPGDPSPDARSKVNTAKDKERLLLVALCVLLVAVVLTTGMLYAIGKKSLKELEKHMNIYEDDYKKTLRKYNLSEKIISEKNSSIEQLQAEKQNLTSELQQSQQHVKQLQEGKDNLSSDLQKRNRTIEKLLTEKKNLTRELEKRTKTIEKLQAEKENLSRELETPKEKAVHCADGWMFFNGSCYYFSTDKETWPVSRDACISEGGDLVIITSPGEQDFIKGSKPGQNLETYWIGLTDAVVENDWRWLDGKKLSKTPKLWTGDEPDNWTGTSNVYPEGEDCAVLDLAPANNGFLDAFCSERKHKRICEAKAAM